MNVVACPVQECLEDPWDRAVLEDDADVAGGIPTTLLERVTVELF